MLIATKEYILGCMKSVFNLSCICMVLSCFSCSADDEVRSQAAISTIHPRFKKVTAALLAIPLDVAEKVAARVQSAPAGFFLLLEDSSKTGDLLWLVDKKHPLARDFVPTDLISLNDFSLSLTRNDLQLRKIVIPDFLAMVTAAKTDKVSLVFASSYRSWSYQKKVFERNVAESGLAEANRVSAQPGQSQHQLGTAFDMNPIENSFAATPAGAWMRMNAWKYGFSLSYPQGYESVTGYDWESWHFRYIGKAASKLQMEYFDNIQQYFLEFWKAYTTP